MEVAPKLAAILCSLFCVAAATAIASTDPDDYGLFRRIPDGCNSTVDCTYFVGMRVNEDDSSYLDFFLTGTTTGWLAIGFSPSRSMQDSDVVGCAVEQSSGDVVALDTYNEVGRLNNALDPGEQTDITLGTRNVTDGRLTCTFTRLIAGLQDTPVDQNLNGSYFFLFGFFDGPRSPNSGFPRHELMGPGRPTILGPNNPVLDVGELPLPSPTGNPLTPGNMPDRLTRRSPSGCDPEQDCDYFMGIATNPNDASYLDFHMAAEISGWVAVGFSTTANMLDADVVGCNVDPASDDQMLFAVDAYNPENTRTNVADNIQDVMLHNFTIDNGRISCLFSRRIMGTGDEQDEDLDGDFYFLFGLGGNGAGMGNFPDHGNRIPQISDGRFNPVSDEGEIGISRLRQQLLQAHGILMILAWPILAFTAIFFAAWMKQALPNGEWFQVHRAFHIAALVVAGIGFILAFVANKDNSPPGLIQLGSQNKTGTTHFVLGIIIMALQIANPIISIFRCKPTGNYRWIFNLIHGFLIGLGVEFLVYVNIGIGVSIFSETQSDFGDLTIFWVYLAFAIFGVVLNTALLLFFTCEAGVKGEEGTKLAPAVTKPVFSLVYGSADGGGGKTEVEMTPAGEQEKPAGPPPRKPPSADAPFRWLGLGLFLGVMLPLMLAVIILIAATGNTD